MVVPVPCEVEKTCVGMNINWGPFGGYYFGSDFCPPTTFQGLQRGSLHYTPEHCHLFSGVSLYIGVEKAMSFFRSPVQLLKLRSMAIRWLSADGSLGLGLHPAEGGAPELESGGHQAVGASAREPRSHARPEPAAAAARQRRRPKETSHVLGSRS